MVLALEPSETAPAFGLGRDRALQSFLQVAIGALLLAPLALRHGRGARSCRAARSSPSRRCRSASSCGTSRCCASCDRCSTGRRRWRCVGLALALRAPFLAGEASRRWVEAPARRVLIR